MSKISSKTATPTTSTASEIATDPSKEDSEMSIKAVTAENGVTLTVSKFGAVLDRKTDKLSVVKMFTWTNRNNVTVQAITFGATITSIKVPGHDGKLEDIVLGFDNMAGYTSADNPNIGCTIGRVANRIGAGKFLLNGTTYCVDLNVDGVNHLHGGFEGWARKNWQSSVDETRVRMTLLSEDGDSGYPGDVLATATFYLTEDDRFFLEYQAVAAKATPLNMTSHSYFNLAGHGAGADETYKHVVTINADKVTVTDKDYIPTGAFACVAGTIYDFRVPREVGPALARVGCNGFDDNFCVQKGTQQELAFIARVLHPPSGRFLEIYSNQPGVQFYTSNSLPNPGAKVS